MPRWFRRLSFRLKERLLGRDTLALLPELERDQHLPPAEREARQWAAMQAVARYAYAHVPAYRRAWAGLDLEALLGDPAGWARLPILTKADVRAAGADLIAPDVPGRVTYGHTSGSTHESLHFPSDVRRSGWSGAARLRAWRWWGLDYGAVDTHLRLRTWLRALSPRARLFERLRRLGVRLAGARHMDGCATQEEDLAQQVETIRRFDPEVIVGYGSLLGHLGLYMRRRGLDLPRRRLRAIVYIADPINAPGQAAVEQALGAPVVCEYSCREFGVVAFQCPAGYLHIPEETLLLETVDAAGRAVVGEPGQVLLSDLRPSRTPYIRYAINDVATLAPRDYRCPCGVTQRVLARFEGRSGEMAPRPDGTLMHPSAIDGLCRPLPGMGHWQTRVTLPNRLRLLVEMSPEALAPWRAGLLAELSAYAGPGFECTIETVEAIEPLPNGKYQRLVIER